MNPVEIIKAKKNNKSLRKEEIQYFINGYLNGEVADYQMSAFLMAVCFNGMSDEETFYLTETMLKSGRTVDLSHIKFPKVDKHSTGGVGDKTSLILAPLVASCEIAVPMISGRGLGHTGGTLDKLESIRGFNFNLSVEEYIRIIDKNNLVMSGQTDELCPADKKIYALRDVTSTIDNTSLITASIMSKKLAEGADSIVFDVKVGTGANLGDYDKCMELSGKLLSIAKKFNKKAIAILTDMNIPLGKKIGNWFEVEECIEVMNGADIPDLLKVNNILAGAMIYLAGKTDSIESGENIAMEKIRNGSAYNKFLETVEIQNGDVNYIMDFLHYKRPEYTYSFNATQDGFITKMDALNIGLASVELGAGRKRYTDVIDPLAGIIFKKVFGDRIMKDDIICELYSSSPQKISEAVKYIREAIEISPIEMPKRKLIIDIIK
ncbi:MAG: thymidine phosphorylase [Ignavibacteria bacterium]|nr:thymidine phosphorylase [Ignavibacteria bacterium]